MFYSVDTW